MTAKSAEQSFVATLSNVCCADFVDIHSIAPKDRSHLNQDKVHG